MIDSLRLRILQTKGLTVDEIAKALNADAEEVKDELRYLGYIPKLSREQPVPNEIIKEVNNTMGKSKYTPEQWDKAGQLKKEGMTYSKIAEKTGIGYKSIANQLKKESEPTTAATVEGSNEEILTSTSTSSLTENRDNVKHFFLGGCKRGCI